jgi:tubulin polyglutamylase TTLL6/13
LPNIRAKGSPSKRRLRPITVNLCDTQYEVVEEVCWELDYALAFEKEGQWDLRWTDAAVSVDALSKMHSHQKVNHFPGMNTLSRKNNLAKNMLKMKARFPEHYTYLPRTFLLPMDAPHLRAYHADKLHRNKQSYYIVKPEASCQGRGIFLS